jgi:hypothetical protein
VRMRLLNLGMAEDDAAFLMRGYESKWSKDDIQIRVQEPAYEDDSDEDDTYDEDQVEDEDEDQDIIEELDDLANLEAEDLADTVDHQNLEGIGSMESVSDDEGQGDDILRSPPRKVIVSVA